MVYALTFAALAFIFALIVFSIAMGMRGRDKRKKNSYPVERSEAKVLEKREQVANFGYGIKQGVNAGIVLFALKSGGRIECLVEKPHFGRLAVGDTGILTHRGDYFENFEPNDF